MPTYKVALQENVLKVFTYEVEASSMEAAKNAAWDLHIDSRTYVDLVDFEEETIDTNVVDLCEVEK